MGNIKEHVFSIELKARRHLKNISLTNGSFDLVLVEGTLGELVQASFKEGIILEVIGKNGTLRIDLTEDEISKTAEQTIIEAETP
ncbi:MAG: hypothetical protein ABSF65_00560 [Candidatus Bathyarchaeia archaeon]|jgi:hypothetical protein